MKEKNNWKYVILFCAAVLVAVGLGQKEAEVVLQKAIHICLECIGIG